MSVPLLVIIALCSLFPAQQSAVAAPTTALSVSSQSHGARFTSDLQTGATTATATATATATPGTPVPSRSCIAPPGSTSSGPTNVLDCVVSAAPNEAFNRLGAPHTVTFLCGSAARLLTGPTGAAYSTTGCFDVAASVVDETTGASASFTSVICAGQPADIQSTTDCSTVSNPICAAGSLPNSTTGDCSPCPANFTFTANECVTLPSAATGGCPPGTTAFPPGTQSPINCVGPLISTTPTSQNEVLLTLNPGAPHSYLIDITGYVGTTSTGMCPPNTTFTPIVTFRRPSGAASITGPACAFDLQVEKKYIEGTKLQIIPEGPCGGSVLVTEAGTQPGSACFFNVLATGTVILKTGVNCADGTEPTSGTSAVSGGFPAGSTYECEGDTLSVTNIPIAGIPITLTATNGFFNPTCVPSSRLATLTPTPAPTDTPVGGPFPTDTPVPTPTLTPTPPFFNPTATPVPPTSTPGPVVPASCGPPGSSTTTGVTNANGMLGGTGTNVEYRTVVTPQYPAVPNFETITGTFLEDLVGVAGVQMFSTVQLPSGNVYCDSGFTNSAGNASCTFYDAGAVPGTPVPVSSSFISNCAEYDSSSQFFPVGPLTPTPTPNPAATQVPFQVAAAPNNICVTRAGLGDLTVEASFESQINTQPSLSTGPVVLGGFALPTPVPTSTSTPAPTSPPAPTATNTPIPTETPTPTGTSAPTAIPTSTPIPTATSTPTQVPIPPPPPPLRFHLDSAKVTQAIPRDGCRTNGLDAVMRGQKTCLEIFYTITSMPGPLKRVATYQITNASGVAVYKVAFPGTQTVPSTLPDHEARFTPYTVPKDLPFGVYTFKGTLTLGGRSQSRVWRFAVVRTALYTEVFSAMGLAGY